MCPMAAPEVRVNLAQDKAGEKGGEKGVGKASGKGSEKGSGKACDASNGVAVSVSNEYNYIQGSFTDIC